MAKLVTQSDLDNVNVKAFLKLIRYCEHQREDDGVYYTIYGGQRFTNTSAHPHVIVYDRSDKHKKHPHTPAGAYQITYATWLEAKNRGIVSDFTPRQQDKLAVSIIASENALDDVEAAKLSDAFAKLRGRWSSLPGATQSHVSAADATARFNRYVGEFTANGK